MNLRVLMKPSILDFQSSQSEGGIRRVVEAYTKHLPEFGIEVVGNTTDSYDLIAAHAGMTGGEVHVAHLHGAYWTADYQASTEEYKVNARIVEAIRHAKAVTVPSEWVALNIARDMRFKPYVVPHGIDWEAWQHDEDNQGFVLYNKNRVGDVCSPQVVFDLAQKFPKLQFVSTFDPHGGGTSTDNVKVIGLLPHERMKKVVQRCGVYLSVTKETFAIGVLEAMAAGKPILYYNYGHVPNLAPHGVAGYGVEPGNEEALADGLMYCIQYAQVLGDNGRELARQYSWEATVQRVAEIYFLAAKDEYEARPAIIDPQEYTT